MNLGLTLIGRSLRASNKGEFTVDIKQLNKFLDEVWRLAQEEALKLNKKTKRVL